MVLNIFNPQISVVAKGLEEKLLRCTDLTT